VTACSDCQASTSIPKHWNTLVPIGKNVSSEIAIGRGHDRTDFYFFQCPMCGSVWMNYEDSGAGGHGNFWERLTKKFF